VLQPQSCKPLCTPQLIHGGAAANVTSADRLRLSAASLLRRVGLPQAASVFARRGGVAQALASARSGLGLGPKPVPEAAAPAAAG
jgi:hypothetical protein